MTIFDWLVPLFWLAFIAYWLISARGVKKNIKKSDWRRDAGIRILLIILVLVVLWLTPSLRHAEYRFGTAMQLLGTILCGAGIAFAIWARAHLGRNWSGTPSMKEGHELVTSGPYRFVRHPIYTGIIAAILGSALVVGTVWFIVFFVSIGNFIWRIPLEERYMTQLFPDQYPEYKKRTKALVPFVW